MDGPVLVEVTIPSIGADPLIVEINNDRYSYRAGETYEVTEDVAEVINNLIASMPSESKPASEPNLPIPTAANAGSAVVVGEDGNFTFGEAGGGGTKIKGVYDESLDSVLLTSAQIADVNQLYVEADTKYIAFGGARDK